MTNATNYMDIMTNTSSGGIMGIAQGVAAATGDFFGYTIILSIFGISFLSMSGAYTKDKILVSGFFAFVSAVMMFSLGLVSINAITITLTALIGAYLLGGKE